MIDPSKLTPEQWARVEALYCELFESEDRVVLREGLPVPLPTLEELEERADRLDPKEVDSDARQALLDLRDDPDEEPAIRDQADNVMGECGWSPDPPIIDVGWSPFGMAADKEKPLSHGDDYLKLLCYENADGTLTFEVQSRQLPAGTKVELTAGSWRGIVELGTSTPGATRGTLEVGASDRANIPDKAPLSNEVLICLPSGEAVRHRLRHKAGIAG